MLSHYPLIDPPKAEFSLRNDPSCSMYENQGPLALPWSLSSPTMSVEKFNTFTFESNDAIAISVFFSLL